MARISFDEVDRLIIDRWLEVSDLVAAYETVQDKLRRQLQAVEDDLRQWLGEQELELETRHKEGEFWSYQREWLRENRDEPWVTLVVGGFSAENALNIDTGRLYACVYSSSGKGRRFNKDVFAVRLRESIGQDQSALWSEDTSRSCPLNRYASGVSAKAVLLDSDRLVAFAREQLTQLAEFIEPISSSIPDALKAGERSRRP